MQTGPGLSSRTRQICCNGDAKTLPDYFSSFLPRPTFSLMWEEPPRPRSPPLQSASAFYAGLLPEAPSTNGHWLRKSAGTGPSQLSPLLGLERDAVCSSGHPGHFQALPSVQNERPGTAQMERAPLEVTGPVETGTSGGLRRSHIWNT